MNLTELKRKKMGELIHMGSELNIEGVSGMRRQDLIFALLQHTATNKGEVYGDGVLETLGPYRAGAAVPERRRRGLAGEREEQLRFGSPARRVVPPVVTSRDRFPRGSMCPDRARR